VIHTIQQLSALVRAGGGLTLDATAYTYNQIADICRAAAIGSARITLRNVGRLTLTDLSKLAALAPGLVTFDFTR
jgi:energy-converting hydrogenase Eha subunit H